MEKRSNISEVRVAERIAFLKTVIDFVESITKERGEELLRQISIDHTHLIQELCDFGNFSFRVESGKNMFGSNNVQVWYHPTRKFTEKDLEYSIVLDFSWQYDVAKGRANVYKQNKEWQKALRSVIRRREEMSATIDKRKSADEARRKAKNEKELAQKKRQEVATRLKLVQ